MSFNGAASVQRTTMTTENSEYSRAATVQLAPPPNLLSSLAIIASDDESEDGFSSDSDSIGESQFFDALERKPVEVVKMRNRKSKSKPGYFNLKFDVICCETPIN